MPKLLIMFFSILLLISCNEKQENKAIYHESLQYSSASPQITVIADLADSLQPKTNFLDKTPKPQRIQISDKVISHTIQKELGYQIVKLSPTEKIKAALSSVMENYTTDQGLASDVISCSYADKKGNLWFGTFTGGVSKYDGKSFTNYTTSQGLISNGINSIMEDRTGNIWFGTDGGVCKYDGTTFSVIENYKKVFIILEDRAGNFWFGTHGGLYKRTAKTNIYSKQIELTVNDVFDLKEDQKGILWLGTENGLYKYDGERFTNITLSNERAFTICTDKSGNTWAGTSNGYIKYNGVGITNYSFKDIVPFVYEDRLGNIWMSAGREGRVAFYNGKSFSYLDKSTGLLFGEIHSITEDKSGNLWFSTAANGTVKYAGKAFQRLTPNSIRSIFEDKNGILWYAGYGGAITKFDGESLTNFALNIPFWSLSPDKAGNIWIGSEQLGLIKFDTKSFTFYTDLNGLTDNAIRSVMNDSKGDIWIGTEKGLSKFDGKSFTNFTKTQGLAGDYVSCIFEDKPGELWIGTNSGLSHYDGKSFNNYSISQGLRSNDIKSLVKDKDGNLWIGAYGGGLSRYDGKSFYTYSTEQGLPDNVVTQVALTKEGNIVLGTNNGIAILTGFKSVSATGTNNLNSQAEKSNYSAQNNLSNAELKNYAPVFEIYNSKTGYPVKDVNRGQHSIFLDRKGILWIASGSEKSGLMRFDYSSLNKNNNPPALNILAIKVGNELIGWNDLLNTKNNSRLSKLQSDSGSTPASVTEEVTTFGKTLSNAQREEMRLKYKGIEFDSVSKFYPIPQNLILPYGNNTIAFEFAAIEPAKPALIQYQYKLEGYDKNWSTAANITSAKFGNIYEGTYTFKIRAQNLDGVWSEPITYTFKVLPPLWRTWWMYAIYLLMAVLIMGGYIKWRERELKKENVILESKITVATKVIREEKEKVEVEKKRSDDLLLNILPSEVAEELKAKGTTTAKDFSEVTVLFTDFKNFTLMSETLSAQELVNEINYCYSAFDSIITKHGIEKIKTIGDAYMCAGGLPVANTTNAEDTIRAALEIRDFMLNEKQQREKEGKPFFEIRIGCNTGPVVAGIVGIKKFAYDIWGDTVNIAARMEQNSNAGKINISGSTYELVKDKFKCEHRGKIEAKNKGMIDMYFVES